MAPFGFASLPLRCFRQIVTGMNWQNVRQFVESWVTQHELPDDLRGGELDIVHFASEEDCRFFYPDRDLISHEAFLNSLVRWVREHGGRTRRVTLGPDHYRTWLTTESLENSPENRGAYVESRYRLIKP